MSFFDIPAEARRDIGAKLLTVLDQLEQRHLPFDMDVWMDYSPVVSDEVCGSAVCLAGGVVSLDPEFGPIVLSLNELPSRQELLDRLPFLHPVAQLIRRRAGDVAREEGVDWVKAYLDEPTPTSYRAWAQALLSVDGVTYDLPSLWFTENWPNEFGPRYDRAGTNRERIAVARDRISYWVSTGD